MADDEQSSDRKRPNILVTGTPGTGKTTTASMIAEALGMKHLSVGEIIKENNCVDGRDEALQTDILDEDKLIDAMEPMIQDAAEEGIGCVVDYHICEIFPERWFDLILVLRAQTDILFDRLTKRGYSELKRSENMESEIMQVGSTIINQQTCTLQSLLVSMLTMYCFSLCNNHYNVSGYFG